jgi:hypothetical protein
MSALKYWVWDDAMHPWVGISREVISVSLPLFWLLNIHLLAYFLSSSLKLNNTYLLLSTLTHIMSIHFSTHYHLPSFSSSNYNFSFPSSSSLFFHLFSKSSLGKCNIQFTTLISYTWWWMINVHVLITNHKEVLSFFNLYINFWVVYLIFFFYMAC